MARSACALGVAFDRHAAYAAVQCACAGLTDASRVRVIASVAGTITVETSFLDPAADLVRLALDRDAVRSSDPLLRHKTTERSRYEAYASRHPDVDDVIMVNKRDEVTETTCANIVALIDGEWWTPPTSCGCLPGVERGRLLDTGAIRERVLTIDDLAAADGLAVISSLRGWREAVVVEGLGAAVR
jgi:para-aminobenzoate synthetase/4-amino-4-deoxychorismate lyase